MLRGQPKDSGANDIAVPMGVGSIVKTAVRTEYEANWRPLERRGANGRWFRSLARRLPDWYGAHAGANVTDRFISPTTRQPACAQRRPHLT